MQPWWMIKVVAGLMLVAVTAWRLIVDGLPGPVHLAACQLVVMSGVA